MAEAGFNLSENDRRILLKAARDAISAAVRGENAPKADAAPPGALKTPCGAFVTLAKHGDLRGCVGFVEAEKPLYDTVKEAAVAAALHDTRFAPVGLNELDDIHVEISVLTPPRKVASKDEIELGRHGIILSKWNRRALFLPQVAPKQGWDIDTTLSHLAMKAGLDPYGWRSGAVFEVFEAIVFEERG